MNGDQVRDTWFQQSRHNAAGYDAREVDDLLHRVAAELDAGRSAGPLIENATLRRRTWAGARRYDIDAVDWFLGQFLLPPGHFGLTGISDDPWGDLPVAQLAPGKVSGLERRYVDGTPDFARQCENAWRDFGQLPGTHLWFGKAPRGLTELRTAEQQTLASVRASWRETISAGGRSFTLKPTSAAESSSPAVAGLPARRQRDYDGHYAENTRIRNILTNLGIASGKLVSELVDETGTPILYTAGTNYKWRAGRCILFPDQRWLRFLVRGTRRENAIMTAVDQAGNKLARYRFTDKSWRPKLWSSSPVELIVHPSRKPTDELALVLAISADWLGSYFMRGNLSGTAA